MEGRLNVIVAGGTASGKTNLLNAVQPPVAGNEAHEEDRFLLVEDTPELPIGAGEFLSVALGMALVVAAVSFFLGAPVLALAGVIVAPALLWQRLESRRDAARQAYNGSLGEAVQLLREGFSSTGALRDAVGCFASAITWCATGRTRRPPTSARCGAAAQRG